MARIAARLRKVYTVAWWTSRRYWLLVAIAMTIGLGLRTPALGGSLLGDDWDHYAMTAGVYPVHRGPFDLYDFVRDDPRERHALLESGRFPWWTSPNLHLAVLRPVASALVQFDFQILDGGHHPIRMHLHSMLWWLLLVAGVAATLPLVLPRGVAALGVWLYALDDAHALPVTWSANRSELIAVALMTWALWARLSFRTRGWRAGRWLGPALAALGLLSGEHALGPLAYIVALELLAGERSARKRVAALAPYALLAIAYLLVRSAMGYGVAGSSFYVDPIAEPLRYVKACAERLPLLLGDLTFGYAAEWKYWEPPFRVTLLDHHLLPASWLTLEHLGRLQYGLGLLASALVLVALRALGQSSAISARDPERAAPARALYWLLGGALLSLVPTCGTLPMSRLTVAAAIGFDAGLAWVLWSLLESLPRQVGLLRRLPIGVLAAAIVTVHLVHSASRSVGEGIMYALRSQLEEAWVLRAELPDKGVEGNRVFLVAAKDWASQFVIPFVRHLHGLTMPASVELLSAASDSPHELVRIAPNVLDVFVPRPIVGSRFLTSVYRHEDLPFRAGDRLSCSRFDVEVVDARGGEPSHLRFSFPLTLDDPRYVFLYPADSGMIRLTIPPVGGRFRLPPPVWPFAKH